MKKFYNPFELFSERQLLFFGLIVFVVGSFIGYLFNGRFDGIVDLDFVALTELSEVFIDNCINTLLLTVLLYLYGLAINTKTRIIDLLNTALIARIPFYVLPFFNVNNLIITTTDSLLQMANTNSFESLTVTDTIIILVFGVMALVTLIWFAILLWNGFRVATNAKGTKKVVLFIVVVLAAEIVSKYLIIQFN
jgi:hypothetical protein